MWVVKIYVEAQAHTLHIDDAVYRRDRLVCIYDGNLVRLTTAATIMLKMCV